MMLKMCEYCIISNILLVIIRIINLINDSYRSITELSALMFRSINTIINTINDSF